MEYSSKKYGRKPRNECRRDTGRTAKRGINVIRRVVANDIAALNDYGYEVLPYKKKYTYYYVVNRPLDTAEVVLIADALKSSKLTPRQKNELIGKLSNLLCCY